MFHLNVTSFEILYFSFHGNISIKLIFNNDFINHVIFKFSGSNSFNNTFNITLNEACNIFGTSNVEMKMRTPVFHYFGD